MDLAWWGGGVPAGFEEWRQPMRREVPPETSAVLNGFKETELGPIPVEWEVVPLREAAVLTCKPRGA